MTDARPPADYILTTASLPRRKKTQISVQPSASEMAELAEQLGATSLRKLSFTGSLQPKGRNDWELDAQLGVTAVQPCAVTLEPVTTRLDVPVTRRFVLEMPMPGEGNEEEDEFGGTAMLDDETLEPLGREINLWAVLTEALALALPDYPRSDTAEGGNISVTEPGKTAMTDADTKPFAGLAALKAKLSEQD